MSGGDSLSGVGGCRSQLTISFVPKRSRKRVLNGVKVTLGILGSVDSFSTGHRAHELGICESRCRSDIELSDHGGKVARSRAGPRGMSRWKTSWGEELLLFHEGDGEASLASVSKVAS